MAIVELTRSGTETEKKVQDGTGIFISFGILLAAMLWAWHHVATGIANANVVVRGTPIVLLEGPLLLL